MVEGREVLINVQNPTFLAQVVSKGMRITMETCNHYMWLTTTLQPPLSIPFPQLSFYHMLTWELPFFNPLSHPPNIDNYIIPPFLYLHQVSDTPSPILECLGDQMSALFQHNMEQENLGNSPPKWYQTTQLQPHRYGIKLQFPPSSPHWTTLNQEQTVNLEELEEALELMRETRTEISVLKDIKIMIFKKKYIKNT